MRIENLCVRGFLWLNLALWAVNLYLWVMQWRMNFTFESNPHYIRLDSGTAGLQTDAYDIAVGFYAEAHGSYSLAFGQRAYANGTCKVDVRPMDAATLKLLRGMDRNIRDVHFAQEQTIEKHCGWKSGTVHSLYLSSLDEATGHGVSSLQ